MTAIRLIASQRGSIVVKFALMLPIVMAVVAGSLDYAMVVSRKLALQTAADTASLAAAREMSLADFRDENV